MDTPYGRAKGNIGYHIMAKMAILAILAVDIGVINMAILVIQLKSIKN